MANRDYDDDRRYGQRGYGIGDDDRHNQGSRWSRGSEDRSFDDRSDRDRAGSGDSWGERLGSRINRFFGDLERDYLGGSSRDRREGQSSASNDGYGRDRDYGSSYGDYSRGGMSRDQRYGQGYGSGSAGSSHGSASLSSQYDRGYGSTSGNVGTTGGYASGGAYGGAYGGSMGGYGQTGMGGGYGQGGHGQGGSEQGNYGQGSYGQGGETRGRGPKGYTRSDSRIEEDVNERLSRGGIDASEVEVKVESGEVTLTGSVNSRQDKRRAEDLADDVSGVKHVQNNLRVQESTSWGMGGSGSQGSYASGSTSGYGQSYASGGTSGSQSGSQSGGGTQSATQSSSMGGQSYTSSDADKS